MKGKKLSAKQFMPLIIILAVLVAVVAIVTPVLAYYLRTADEVESNYTPAEPNTPTTVKRIVDEKSLEDLYFEVEDKGYPVYVRAQIVITWQKYTPPCENPDCGGCEESMDCEDEDCLNDCPWCMRDPDEDPDGTVYFRQPVEGEDYSITLNTADWAETETVVDGKPVKFYYCTSPVASGGKTKVFIQSCSLMEGVKAPVAGYVLCVEVIVQTVQAIGATDKDDVPAWQDAWGISSMPPADSTGNGDNNKD